jgi:enoyl-CoA hydratase
MERIGSDEKALVMVDQLGGVARVTLNRPAAMNALSVELRAQFGQAMRHIAASASTEAVILTGSGTRAFCAGLDLQELERLPDLVSLASSANPDCNPVAAIALCPQPVIAAINGAAVTGGFELALACDILVASNNARFADTHARVGVMPGWGLSQKLSRIVGPARASQLSFTGQFIDADTAARWGIVSEVVHPSALSERSEALASEILKADAGVIRAYKELMRRGWKLPAGEALSFERSYAADWNA